MKILGIAFLILIVLLSMFLVFPPAGWMPRRMEASRCGCRWQEDGIHAR